MSASGDFTRKHCHKPDAGTYPDGRSDGLRRQSATTTTTDVGATTTLTPGMITTGFNMTLLPLIQKTGNLQLQMNFNLSDPPTIRSFTSKDGNSYIEMPYTKLRSLSQKVNLKEGQSLVVTGFDQNNTTTK